MWVEAATKDDNPYLQRWQSALRWGSDVSEEFVDLYEAAEEAARRLMPEGKATGDEAHALLRLEEAYKQLWAARGTVDRRVGEALDSFVKQQKQSDTRRLDRARQEKALKDEQRNKHIEELRKKRVA